MHEEECSIVVIKVRLFVSPCVCTYVPVENSNTCSKSCVRIAFICNTVGDIHVYVFGRNTLTLTKDRPLQAFFTLIIGSLGYTGPVVTN